MIWWKNVIDICSEMDLAGQLPLHDNTVEGPSNVPGPIQSNLFGSDVSLTESQIPPVKVEDHKVKSIVMQGGTFVSPGEKTTDEKREVILNNVFDSKKPSPGRKAQQATRSTSFHNLDLTLADGVLDYISKDLFKESLAHSMRNDVRRSVSLPQFVSGNIKSDDSLE